MKLRVPSVSVRRTHGEIWIPYGSSTGPGHYSRYYGRSKYSREFGKRTAGSNLRTTTAALQRSRTIVSGMNAVWIIDAQRRLA